VSQAPALCFSTRAILKACTGSLCRNGEAAFCPRGWFRDARLHRSQITELEIIESNCPPKGDEQMGTGLRPHVSDQVERFQTGANPNDRDR
jgi:hypothetical protein